MVFRLYPRICLTARHCRYNSECISIAYEAFQPILQKVVIRSRYKFVTRFQNL